MVNASVGVLRYAFQEAKDILEVQSGSLSNLRSNAATILGFDGVILGISVAGFTFLRNQGLRILDFPLAMIPLGLAALALLASTLMSASCLLPKRLVGGLPVKQLVEVIDYDVDEPEFIAQAIRAYERFVNRNIEVLESTETAQSRAARALRWGIILYAIGVAALLYQGV